jgi:hypothetical protein
MTRRLFNALRSIAVDVPFSKGAVHFGLNR